MQAVSKFNTIIHSWLVSCCRCLWCYKYVKAHAAEVTRALHTHAYADRTSFANVTRWVEDVRTERGTDVVIMIVGNKTDLADRRQVSTDEGERVAREQGVLFIETSAKANYNIKALFQHLATTLPGSSSAAPVKAESNLIDIRLQAVPPAEKASTAVSSCSCWKGIRNFCTARLVQHGYWWEPCASINQYVSTGKRWGLLFHCESFVGISRCSFTRAFVCVQWRS